MEKIKGFFSNLFSNQIVKKAFMILFIFLFIVVFIIIIASCSNKKAYSYEELEKKMVTITKETYENKKDKLPKNDKDMVTVSLENIIKEGKLKNNIKGDAKCTGEVKIINNNGYYLYIPYLKCEDKYESKTLYNTLTNDKNITVSGNGLYQVKDEYIYKGDTVNNYLKLNGTVYRILRINDDKTVRLIDTSRQDSVTWDDRYNVDKQSYVGINSYIYNSVNSRIKDTIERTYENLKDNLKPYLVTTKLCTGRRSINDNIFDRSIECSESLISYPIGLMTVSEFYVATIDKNCNAIDSPSCLNYNYLSDFISTWTLTPDKDTSYKVYKINTSGAFLSNASTNSTYRIVITLNPDLVVESGDGSDTNPYVIKQFVK